MGDIYGTIQVVLPILSQLITAEISHHAGLKDDANAIKRELQTISVFLMNAEEKAEGDDADKEWVRQIRVLAYDIEDAIERYHMYLRKKSMSKGKEYILRRVSDMASTIKSLRERSASIAAAKERYKFTNKIIENGQGNYQGIMTTAVYQCTNTLGNDVLDGVAKGEIISLLGFDDIIGSPSTIAVVGMRGLGKTTIVTSVYYDDDTRSYFPLRAWISMSKCKEDVDIIRKIIVQFSYATNKLHGENEVNDMDVRSLQDLLQRYIHGKRYLVVFDNVKEGDIKMTASFKCFLHSNNEGSKMLITTRYANVAHEWLNGSVDSMYKLKSMRSEKAWELFCKKTFQRSGGKCPAAVHRLARGIVKKCGGLPPVINSVGSLLSAKEDDINEWTKVRYGFGFYLSANRQLSGIHKTFIQSYYDLPFYLKPCFLYFGLFPKGYPIGRMRLIRLWIAEGFIRETEGNLTLEEVAEEYISELINMSMIEVKSRDPSGKVRTLGVVSKFLHEMISTKLNELSFCKILSKKMKYAGDEKYRRLSVHKSYDHNVAGFPDGIEQSKPSSTRSLFMIDVVEPDIMTKVLNKAFLKSITLLKILDLSNAPIDVIPKDIGRLLNLHYLSLRCTRVSTLPGTIGLLGNLQTLDLKQTFISELPKEFIQLHKLRHLLVYNYHYDISFDAHCMRINGMKIPEGLLGQCSELQKLAFLDLNVAHRNWVHELRYLTQLRKLGIIGLKCNEGKAMSSVIDGMNHLESLNIFSTNKSEPIDLVDVRSPPRLLKRLYLSGPLLSFPSWIYILYSLVKIRLRWSKLKFDSLQTLQYLPNLTELQLLEAFTGEKLEIASHGFQKLKVLHLLELHNLKSLSIAEGALPLLDEMSIGKSESLEMPSGIKYLSTLTTLNFYDMPECFNDRILPGQVHYPIVKHVHTVLFHNKDSNGCRQTYTLQ